MIGTRALSRLVAPVVAFVMLAALVAPGGAARADIVPLPLPSFPSAKFDWKMPDRLGLDANHDGVIDSRTTSTQIDPAAWQVTFDACNSTASDNAYINLYKWYVDRVPLGVPDAQTSPCGVTYSFPEEGTYEITLEIRDSRGLVARSVKMITVQDWLIVAIGDSYGSGQGNPDIPIPQDALEAWRVANAALLAAASDLFNVQGAYDLTSREITDAKASLLGLMGALAHEADVCNPFSDNYDPFGECIGSAATAVVDATVLLTNDLLELGLTFSMESLDLFEDKLADLQTVADAALTAATTAWELAGTALVAAEAGIPPPVWQDRRCNRSAFAGQAQAALALEEADPHTSVTLVHLACSGAQIDVGLLGPYAGAELRPGEEGTVLDPQVDVAKALIRDREVDAVLLSVGGNDVGFGDIIVACMFQDPCTVTTEPTVAAIGDDTCSLALAFSDLCGFFFDHYYGEQWNGIYGTDSAAAVFADRLPDLSDSYGELATALAAAFPAVEADSHRVFITEYPNTLEDQDGVRCVSRPDNFATMLPGFSPIESEWLHDVVAPAVNQAVYDAAAADDIGWSFVGGIYDAFARHGYCSTDSWVRRIQDSFLMQGTMEGAAHPTANGNGHSAQQIQEGLFAALYLPVGGTGSPDFTAPRLPDRNLIGVDPDADTTPPWVKGAPDRLPDGDDGWYSAPVTIAWWPVDPRPSSGRPTDPVDTVANIEGTNTYTSAPSCDPALNCATGTLKLSIDLTAPAVVCPADLTFEFRDSEALVTAGVMDPISGPVAAIVSGPADTSSVGVKAVSLTGQDIAGNETTVECAYTVVSTPWMVGGTGIATQPGVGVTTFAIGGAQDSGGVQNGLGTVRRGSALYGLTLTSMAKLGGTATLSGTAWRCIGLCLFRPVRTYGFTWTMQLVDHTYPTPDQIGLAIVDTNAPGGPAPVVTIADGTNMIGVVVVR